MEQLTVELDEGSIQHIARLLGVNLRRYRNNTLAVEASNASSRNSL